MALLLDASTEYFLRTTGTLPTYNAVTAMAWIRPNGWVAFEGAVSFGKNSSSFQAVGRATGYFGVFTGSAIVQGTLLTDDVWVHVAYTCAGTGATDFKGYLNGVQDIATTGVSVSPMAHMYVGNDAGTDPMTADIGAVKAWGAVLTADEILNEMMYYIPLRTANLISWHPFLVLEGIDYSGNGNTLTQQGTPTIVSGPPISWGPGYRKMIIPPTAAVAAPKRNPMILMGV